MRIILFTGKGGVGKTTVAAATASRIAATGAKTLVMSTDPAHSLADAFAAELCSEPLEVSPNLWAEQIDVQQRLEENWKEIRDHAAALLNWAGLAEIEAEELSVIPGLDEVFSLADVKRHHDHDPYDALIVDCAPTGETLRLLSLPDIIRWYMERVFPVERRIMGTLRPVAKRLTSFPFPDEGVYGAVERFYQRLDGVRELLRDRNVTSIRLVVNAERMVIAEAMRTFTYLSLFGYRVDAIVANRLLPDAVEDPYFERWKQIQTEHMKTIEEAFLPTPILRARLHDRELAGPVALTAFAHELYGDLDADEVLYEADPVTLVKDEGRYVLSMHLPFAEKDDLELSAARDELFVKVGPYRRTLSLPAVLSGRAVAGAQLVGERLEVTFD